MKRLAACTYWVLVLFLSLAIVYEVAVNWVTPWVANRAEAAAAIEETHWLTTSSGIRHNQDCRWYKKSKGQPCGPNEGRACKVCGG